MFQVESINCKCDTNCTLNLIAFTVASEAYHDWSGEAVGVRLRVNFTLKLLLSQNFCNRPLMRFISFASNIGPAAAVPAGPAPAPLIYIIGAVHLLIAFFIYCNLLKGFLLC